MSRVNWSGAVGVAYSVVWVVLAVALVAMFAVDCANAAWAALAALDPNDDTLLPDGSRLVDALALKLVAEHLFGVEAS